MRLCKTRPTSTIFSRGEVCTMGVRIKQCASSSKFDLSLVRGKSKSVLTLRSFTSQKKRFLEHLIQYTKWSSSSRFTTEAFSTTCTTHKQYQNTNYNFSLSSYCILHTVLVSFIFQCLGPFIAPDVTHIMVLHPYF